MNFADVCADSGRVVIDRIPQRGWPLTAKREPWRIPRHFRAPPKTESPPPDPPGVNLPKPGTKARKLYDIMARSRGEKFSNKMLCALMQQKSIGCLLAHLKQRDMVRQEGNHKRMLWWVPL